MSQKQEMPHTIYAGTIEGKPMWFKDRIISDFTKYWKHSTEMKFPQDIGDMDPVFRMLQDAEISIGKAREYLCAWTKGELDQALRQDER